MKKTNITLIKYALIMVLLIMSTRVNYCQLPDTANLTEYLQLSEELSRTNPREAIKLAEKALAMSTSSGYEKGIMQSAKKLGDLYLNQGKAETALTKYYKALEISGSSANDPVTMELLNNIGVAYQQQGKLGQALEYHLQSFDIARELEHEKGIAASSNNIGIVHYQSNNTQKALQYFRYALEAKKALQDTFSLKQSLSNIASVYVEHFKYDSALLYYNQCLGLEQKMNDLKGQAVTHNNIGQVHMRTGKLDQAEKSMFKALQALSVSDDRMLRADIYDNLGLLNYYRQDYEKALQYYDSCLTIARSGPNEAKLSNVYLHLSELHTTLGNYKDALHYFKTYERLSNKMDDEKRKASTSEALFLKQQKENNILRLEKEQETKKLQISILLSTIGFLVIAVFIAYMYYRLRQKNIMEKTLAEQQRLRFKAVMDAQEQERKRIAGDLHDSIGQLLSVVKLNMSDLADSIPSGNGEQKQQFNESLNLIDDACNEVRSISHNIMPPVLIRSGILAALREMVKKVNQTGALKITLTVHHFPERLNENTEIALYRIIQEMVNNIIKHAKATVAGLELSREGQHLVIRIYDNGIGIDKHDVENSPGIGWKNIYSRLSALNGSLDIEKGEKEGSDITFTVPG